MIHVYAVDVSCMESNCYESLYAAASPERKVRADKSRSKEASCCTIVAEALLHYCLKKHLALTEYPLEKNGQGKPRLGNCPDFHFNISHSGHWVVLACGETEVGIDVEHIRVDEKQEKLARRFFTPQEQNFIFREPQGTEERFFQIWTAKESYLKYLGTGLQKSLKSFCVRSMEHPHFFFHKLKDCAMTLCTEESACELAFLTPEQLQQNDI